MAQFDDAKIGDRVWHIQFGWGEIILAGMPDPTGVRGHIKAKFEKEEEDRYFWLDGKRFTSDKSPTLFWDEVKIDPPERPKEHEHDFYKPTMQIMHLRGECDCGAEGLMHTSSEVLNLNNLPSNIPKPGEVIFIPRKCEACEFLNENRDWSALMKFLLNQHHTCEKGAKSCHQKKKPIILRITWSSLKPCPVV